MSSTPDDPTRCTDVTGGEVVDLGAQPRDTSGSGRPASGQPWGSVLAEHPARSRPRGVLIGGGLLALALVGGGAAYAVAALSGGGAQPEAGIPSSALAIVKVDLDPGAGQKVDALRFARRFPAVSTKMGSSDDPRRALFEAATDAGELSGDWATDVEPWLGQRAALAVVPGASADDDPAPILVLAVTDAAKARAGLAAVTDGKTQCAVAGEFAVCAKGAAVVTKAIADAERSSLADDGAFRADVESLGGAGVALAWLDLARAKAAVPALESALRGTGAAGLLGGSALGSDLKGRYVAALRFDGPNLEITGRVDGATLPAIGGASGVGDLPAGTIAALGTGGADQIVDTAWTQLRATFDAQGMAGKVDEQVAALQDQYGIAIPGDIRAAVGKRVVVAFGGPGQDTPDVALRLGGTPDSVAKLVDVVAANAGDAVTLGQATAGSETVIGSTQAYADKVATGSGLGSSKVFTDAVPAAKDAQQVAFVDIAGLLAVGYSTLGLDDTATQNLKPLSALGMSTSRDGPGATFRVRLTTR